MDHHKVGLASAGQDGKLGVCDGSHEAERTAQVPSEVEPHNREHR